MPLYTLAVAVDDVLMKITHIVRGEDLLSSTPRQVAVYRAMGVAEDEIPEFAHLPIVLGPDGQRLSKRNGVVSIAWYRHEGFLAEAIINYLALLGWSLGDDREEFTLAEMVEAFDLSRVNSNSARFDLAEARGDQRRQDPRAADRRVRRPDHAVPPARGLVADPPTADEARVCAAGRR